MYDYIVKIKMKVIFLLWKASTMYKQSYEKREMRVREGLARMKFFNFYIQIDNFTFLLGYLQRDDPPSIARRLLIRKTVSCMIFYQLYEYE